MDRFQLITAREELKAAQGDLNAAHTAIQTADGRSDTKQLRADFDSAETAYRKTKIDYDVAESMSASRSRRGRIQVREDLTYSQRRGSFFRDMLASREGNLDAQERLQAHTREMQHETGPGRSQFDLNSTDATGGQLVAPLYLQEEFISYARAGMAVAQAIGPRDLPPNTDTVLVPRMSTGTAVATQSDNAAVQETDASFDNVTGAVLTIAGMQDVSRQVVDRSQPGTDEVIFSDLARAFGSLLDSQVINSSTTNNLGLLQVSGINSITYTDASPTVAELYPKLADAIQQIHSKVFTSATAIFMHPRRWGWILAALDTQNRPLITPYAPSNPAGEFGAAVAEGLVGSIQGLPIYVDANIPTTLGGSTNEDRIIVVAAPECYLFVEPAGPFLQVFEDVGSGTLTVRYRLHTYWAQVHGRRPAAISAISGSGMSAPSF